MPPMETYSCQTLLVGVDDLDITVGWQIIGEYGHGFASGVARTARPGWPVYGT